MLAVAAELGYRPNPHARALLSGKHHTVAMVVSDITNPHYFELIRGAEMRARVSEYTLLLVNAEESPRVEWEQIQRLAPAVDGFVLAASRLPDENLRQIAAQRPVVLMSRELPGLASVVLDHVEGCRQIVAHLASLGHRDLLYLAGPRNSWMAGDPLGGAAGRRRAGRARRLGGSGRSRPRSARAARPPTARSTPAPPRSSRTTTCSRSASCSGSRSAAFGCPTTSASSASTTSSPPTSAHPA